ncbi:MAG TPA: GyrI-like domain-containing protein [Anaerolineales bacterium]|nr:GyrI-like domain-containing protein [Anaerolineales bacterium]
MKKLDLRRQFKPLLSPPSKEVVVVQVPRAQFLMIDGQGDPNAAAFHEAMQALYALSFGLKFTLKKEKAIDYPVMPMEGLWWTEGVEWFDMTRRQDWRWTLMILQPDVVTKTWCQRLRAETLEKGKAPAAVHARLEPFREGRCVQIMHLGPYATEGPTIARLHDAMRQKGWVPNGHHHEIYLGDPRRSAPEKLRTVLRQPVRAG